jgi:hypothetical protein
MEDGPRFPAMAAAGGRPFRLMMVVVLGFFFCEDEDLPDVDPSSSSQRDEFWKAPTINVAVHLLPEVRRIRWYPVACTHAFILTVWFRRERREAPVLC